MTSGQVKKAGNIGAGIVKSRLLCHYSPNGPHLLNLATTLKIQLYILVVWTSREWLVLVGIGVIDDNL